MNRSSFNARTNCCALREMTFVPRGAWARNEPKRISESNFFQRRKAEGEGVENLLHVFERLRAVCAHLFRPAQACRLEHGLEDEQRPIEPQRFPSLRKRSTRFPCLDDHRGMTEKGHGPIAPRKVRAQRWMPGWELRHDEVLVHQPPLQRCIRTWMCFVERCSEHRNRPAAAFHR